ncbi:ABC transporter ATP-binding protein [Nocardioides sp.]|uniref:ABC transporter ATP-binding protein n=1 Tax=Nocardioides sp. TaxID=35761 RepID=UPI0039E2C4AC
MSGSAEPAEPAGLPGLPDRGVLALALRVSPVLCRGLPVTVALALVAGAARVIAPLAVRHAVDHGLAADAVRAAVLVAAVATVAAGLSSWRLSLRIRGRVETAIAGLRREGLLRVHDMAPSTVDGLRRADLVARLSTDLDAMTTFLNGGGVQFVTNMAQLLIAGAVLALYSWQLALPVFAIAVGLLLVMARLQRVIQGRFARVRGDLSALQSTVGEAVTGATVIRATGAAERSRRQLDEAVDRARDGYLRAQPPLHLSTSLGEVGITAMTLTVLLGGVWWSIGTTPPRLSSGELVGMILLITFFVRPLQFLMQSLGEAQNALTGWRRALELVATPSARIEHGAALPPGPVAVGFDGVDAAYGDGPPVLRDISVGIAPAEQVAVVGRTGSGKSTFAKLLTRRLVPRAGVIRLSGVPLADLGDDALAGRVVVVPQDPFLFDLSVADNIALGRPGATREDVLAALDRVGLGDWALGLAAGLDTPAGPRGERLSVGERQLVALARTALADPDLLVLDEATSGVDPATDVAVQRALARLSQGRTTIAIAHRLGTAANADRVLEFADGRIVQDGSHADLIAAGGSYTALFAHWREHVTRLDARPAPLPAILPATEGPR